MIKDNTTVQKIKPRKKTKNNTGQKMPSVNE